MFALIQKETYLEISLMMKYAEALNYMYNSLPMFQRQGKIAFKKNLTNIKSLCKAFGNPQKNLKFIHIAGTNGKGSVSHMLAGILQAHGYKTGLFISPHYKDFRERIKINGEYISKSYVRNFIELNIDLFDKIKPSFFEINVVMAFCWFRDQQTDYAVIETGLGGRLDSTNIITPLLSIITNISWDHSDMLGNTLEKIAGEKAGIIKRGIPVLIGRKQKETKSVFRKHCIAKKSVMYYAEDLLAKYKYKCSESGVTEIRATFLGKNKIIFPELMGLYQWENIRTVLAACNLLAVNLKFPLSADKIKYAIEHVVALTRIMGRWEIISRSPLIICDSAHNEDGLLFLIHQLQSMQFKKLHVICGFVKDKPLDRILKMLPTEAEYYFVKANIPRALPANELRSQASAFNLIGKNYSSVRKGLATAKRVASKKDLIIVTGSIFVVAEVL